MAENPERLDEVKSLPITGDVTDFVTKLDSQIESENSFRTNWLQAVDRLKRLRYGIRTKKTKPWLGAANFSIPLIDSDIAKLKPAYINVAHGVSPIVTFAPYGQEDVEPMRKREQLFDWRLRTQVKFFEPYNYGVDQILGAAGMTVFRNVWNFTTKTYFEKLDIDDLPKQVQEVLFDPRVTDEMMFKIVQEELRIDIDFEENVKAIEKAVADFRKGVTEIELELIEIKDDQPEVTACDVSKDIIFPWGTTKLQDARFIRYSFWESKNEIKIKMRDDFYEEFSDDRIDSWVDKNGDRTNDDMVLMHETCAWYDINDDGIEEKVIVTHPDQDTEAIVRFIELPYDHGQFPYVLIKRELTDAHAYATRGIPSLDEDFQRGISVAVNQAVDNGTILNSPERVARRGALSNPRNRRYVPGEFVEVKTSLADYETRVVGNVTQGVQFQQAQYLKSWADNRLQQQPLSDTTTLPGSGQGGKKTATEVEAQLALQTQANNLDILVFQQQMADVYFQLDALYYQFGNDEEEIAITGEQPVKISRDEIQGKFNIVPNGRLDNSTPQQRLQKTLFAFNIGASSPQLVNQIELLREVFADLDPRYPDRFVKSDEQLAQEAKQQAEAIARAKQEQSEGAFQARKISDDMDIRKEILLEPIQGKKFAAG